MDIVRVPIEIGDRPIVLSGIEHDEIKQRADGEAAPNPQIIVHLHLADRHPLKIGSYGVHLPLINTDATVLDE